MRLAPFLTAALASLPGCLSAPKTSDWIAVGFRAPEQTFRTFQTAVRADAPELEYRCFSSEFVRRNGLSKLAWREAREELREREPLLRVGIGSAEIVGDAKITGRFATLDADAFGRRVRVQLVREDFGEVWAGAELAYDETLDFARSTGIQEAGDGRRLVFGRVTLPRDETRAVTEVRVGREWKIDGISEAEPHEPGSNP